MFIFKNLKPSVFVLFFFFVVCNVTSDELNLNEIKLGLDKCLELAVEKSYDAIINKLDKEQLDLDSIDQWFVYLPKVSYSVDYKHDFIDVGKEGNHQLPSQYDEQTLSIIKDMDHKVKFQQRLFDSSTISTIVNSKNYKLNKEIILNNFITTIRYLVRNLYYDILISQKEIDFYKRLLEYYNKKIFSNKGIEGLFLADNKITKLSIERKILELTSSITQDKLTLLSTIRLPLTKKIIFTSKLEDVIINKKKDTYFAIENSIILKQFYISKSIAQKDYAMSFLDFMPSFEMDLNAKFNDNFRLGVDIEIDGKKFTSDVFGEYLVYDYENNYYLNRITNEEDNVESNEYSRDYDITDINLTLIGTISLDKLAKNGVRVKELKNKTIAYNTNIAKEKDNIILYIENKIFKINEIKKKLEILEEKINYTKMKKELLDKGGIQNTIEKVDYYEDINSLMLNNVENLYNENRNLFDEYALYFQMVDGKQLSLSPKTWILLEKKPTKK